MAGTCENNSRKTPTHPPAHPPTSTHTSGGDTLPPKPCYTALLISNPCPREAPGRECWLLQPESARDREGGPGRGGRGPGEARLLPGAGARRAGRGLSAGGARGPPGGGLKRVCREEGGPGRGWAAVF